jgi:thiamine biosynthesis lipoprotein
MSEASRNNRREFLMGRSAAQALGGLVQRLVPGEFAEAGSDAPIGETYLFHAARRAMACQFEVFLNAGQYRQETEAALQVLDLVSALEEQLSYFRPESELSRINALAAARPVEVEPGLFGILQLALQLSVETGGALDITSTPLWEAWGFARRAGAVPSDEQLADAKQLVGSHLVELNPHQHTVRFTKPGVRLNLGSMGKGYALDRCAETMAQLAVEHFLIHGGQSSMIARGMRGIAAPGVSTAGPGWVVGLRHPLRPDRRAGDVRLRERALGTSGSQFQSFWHQGRRYGHILDPRSGYPAQNVYSVTVVAPSALLADALSTTFFVMSPEAVLDYCRTRPELAVLLFCPARRRGGVEIRSSGFAEDTLALYNEAS